MSYDATEARKELLDAIGTVADGLADAIGRLGVAYEILDEATGDKLEEQLFRPVQSAYGIARRTHSGFADRFVLPQREFSVEERHDTHSTVRELVVSAVDQVSHADSLLTELQDSMRPVEVGDAELRAGLAEIRTALSGVRQQATKLLSLLGR